MDNRSTSRISNNQPAPSQPGLQVSPSASAPAFTPEVVTLPGSRRTLFVVLLAIGVIVVGVAAGVFIEVWKGDVYFHDFYFRPSGDASRVVSSEMQLCEKYRMLKNDGNPEAGKLLTPLPAVPVDPISQEEADRLQANCFLHQDIRILAVRGAPSSRFVLVTEGNVSAPTLQVRSGTRVDRIQRAMISPDLIVEVRDGIIHGIRAEMHSGQ